MKEFDHVLPSNIISNDYPNNTPSDFTTQLINPINLEGPWEVGVKSIFYASSIGNKDEKANVKLTYYGSKEEEANNVYPVHYTLTKDRKWDYSWRYLKWKPKFPTQDIYGLIKALNAMNRVVTSNVNAFHFKYDGRVTYQTQQEGFTMRMTIQLTRALGYQWRVFLSMHSRPHVISNLGEKEILQELLKLKPEDLAITTFDRNVVKRKARIVFKAKGEAILSQAEFLKRWTEKVEPLFNAQVVFKSEKVVVIIRSNDGAITFNSHMNYVIQHEEALFGTGEFWANYPYQRQKKTRVNDEWIIDIYGDEMKRVRVPNIVEMQVDMFPRHYTLEELIKFLSESLTLKLRQNHCHGVVSFSIDKNFTQLKQPEEADMELSLNLANILGFKSLVLKGKHHISNILPATLDQREQEIYIHSDIIDRMNYGAGKRQMLQHFIHNKPDAYGIVEKFFNPIVYQPVVKNHINCIHIQLLGNYEQQLYIKDSKTIVTLHFRLIT